MCFALNLFLLIYVVLGTSTTINFASKSINMTTGSCSHEHACQESYKGCYCDDLCIEYGDCCLQAKVYNQKKMKEAVEKYECVSVLPEGSYYMKRNCMNDWPDDIVKKQCVNSFTNLSSENSHNDPFLNTPVTSAMTNITYKNHYCAVCHNESLVDLNAWKVELNCLGTNESMNDSYHPEKITFVNGTWILQIDNTDIQVFNSCDVSPVVSETMLHKIRKCEKNIDTCSPSWKDEGSANLCRSYINLVYNKAHQGLPYRNLHCAICNFVNTNNLECYKTNIMKSTESESSVSLSVLFDFSAAESYCTTGHTWDPFSKQCRTVSCQKKNYEFHHGRCFKVKHNLLDVGNNYIESSNPNNSGEINETSCDKVFINETDFTTLPNLSVLINSTSQLYDPDEYEIQEGGIFVCIQTKYSTLMGQLTLIGLSLSSICIVLHLIVFSIVPELRNLSGKNFASLCVALLAAYICFIISTFNEADNDGCQTLASAMYYFFLASFAWMNVISFDVWRTFQTTISKFQVSSGVNWKKFFWYSGYAWAFPAIALSFILAIDNMKPNFLPVSYLPELGQKLCWFGQRNAILVYFAAPVALIMTMNIIFFVMSVRIVAATSTTLNSLSASQSQKVQLKVFFRLAVLMGLSWTSGIIAGIFENKYIWYVFIILNGFQGLYILIAYTCTKKVRKALTSNKGRLLTASSRNSSANKLSNVAKINFHSPNPQLPVIFTVDQSTSISTCILP